MARQASGWVRASRACVRNTEITEEGHGEHRAKARPLTAPFVSQGKETQRTRRMPDSPGRRPGLKPICSAVLFRGPKGPRFHRCPRGLRLTQTLKGRDSTDRTVLASQIFKERPVPALGNGAIPSPRTDWHNARRISPVLECSFGRGQKPRRRAGFGALNEALADRLGRDQRGPVRERGAEASGAPRGSVRGP